MNSGGQTEHPAEPDPAPPNTVHCPPYTVHCEVLISDTIGFIQDLPPQLIDAFRSTLDETVDADLLLHVIDASDPFMADKINEVEDVLSTLGVEHKPKMYVFNKIDLVKKLKKNLIQERYASFTPCFASAVTGEGLETVKQMIVSRLGLDE